MAEVSTVRLTLELDSAQLPITGWVETSQGQRRSFIGMLELIGLVERARDGRGLDAHASDGADRS